VKTAIILHLYYQDLWEEFKERISPILSDRIHLYVTVHDKQTQYYEDIVNISTKVFVVENRGLDVAPFIYCYNEIKDKGYHNYLKLHSKKSTHTPGIGDVWRRSLYYPLVNNYKVLQEQVQQDNAPWMIGVQNHYYDMLIEPRDHPNKLAAKPYLDQACKILEVSDEGCFFAGTMFILSHTYLELLFAKVELPIFYKMFEEGYTRDSLAHGMERVLGYGIYHFKGTYYTI
jgi:lipopolysaccharide biosynthesis protein